MSTAPTTSPKSPIPKVTKMSMKSLVGKKQSKTVQFMDTDLIITKLNVGDVEDIQTLAKKLEGEAEQNDMGGLEILRTVIRKGAEGAADLTDEDFATFPMDELSALSTAIMEFSGIGKAGN